MSETRFFTHEELARDGGDDIRERMRAAFQAVQDFAPPTDEKLLAMIEDAKARSCGFSMSEGRPGTFRVNQFVQPNTLMTLKGAWGRGA